MIIEHLPPEITSTEIDYSSSAFSDNTRFIYMLSYKTFELIVYDFMYNRCIVLNPDAAITEQFDQTNKENLILGLDIHFVDEQTLLISIKDDCFPKRDGTTFILLIGLDYSSKRYSLLDKLLYKECYYAATLRDGNQFALAHIFPVNGELYDGTDFFACVYFQVQSNHLCKLETERILCEIDYEITRPYRLYFYNNRLWFLLDQVYPNINVCYLDLSKPNPKMEHFDVVKDTDQFEFSILDLSNGVWSKIRNNAVLQNYDKYDSNLIHFTMNNHIGSQYYTYRFDKHLNVIAIDKSTKQLYLLPLK
ncbi:hypothetical protein M3Y94_00970500 [Aphelenchoides besseyi]|nr:hypothetical protein M3Y94_00970500 [Aphelenchoides besseyi]